MNNNSDLHKYDDIIDLPHFVSSTHPHMSIRNRASQFAPFAALTGYEDAVNETARVTDKKIELDDNTIEIQNEKLQIINEHLKEHPNVSITYFKPDEKKAGGSYVTLTERVKKIDQYEHTIVMANEVRILIEDILDMQGEIFK